MSELLVPLFTVFAASDGPQDGRRKVEIWQEPNGVWLARLNWPADESTRDAVAELIKQLL